MRAILCTSFGPPDKLVLADLPVPVPGPGQALVRVQAASVNFPDTLMIQGKYQHQPGVPFTPGYELAGVIEKVVADGPTGLRPGDHIVAMMRSGGFAEQAVVPLDRCWKIPAGMDPVSAAAFPLAYGTSYHALKDRAQLRRGETLLVLGAAGGVGLAAVQLGKLMGARVIACASSADKLRTCMAHGADAGINYEQEDFRAAVKRITDGAGIDVTVDPVGGRFTEPAVRSMARGGRHCVVGFTAGEIPRLPLNLPLLKGCAIVGVAWDTYSRSDPEGGQRNMAELIDWIASGKLVPVVGVTYPLEQAARALDDLMQRRVQGKIVLIP